jgi:hypothetical protein
MMLFYYGSSIPAVLSLRHRKYNPWAICRAQQNRQREKGNPSHIITNFYVTMNYNNIPYMPSKRYKVVNPYAVCYKMKKNYGWSGHDKWQRCVDKIKDKFGRKRKSYLCYRTP